MSWMGTQWEPIWFLGWKVLQAMPIYMIHVKYDGLLEFQIPDINIT